MVHMKTQPECLRRKMCRKRKRPGTTAASSAATTKNSHRMAAASVYGLTTALVIVGSSLAVFAAAATGGDVDATYQMQNYQNSRQLQIYDNVLIHLESQCNACIGIDTPTGVAESGSNLEIVDCADTSTNVQKLWRISQNGNWCSQDSEFCVFYNPAATGFDDLLSMQSREVNPTGFESQNQKWFLESTGELTRMARADQCVVLTGTDGVELRPCASTGESKRQWTLVEQGQYACDADSLTGIPTTSPTPQGGGGGGPTEAPTTLPPTSSSPTTTAPSSNAPSSAPTSAPMVPASSAPSSALSSAPSSVPSSSPSLVPSSTPSSTPSASSPGTVTPTNGGGNTTDSGNNATTTGDNNTDESKGDGNNTDIGIGSGSDEEYNGGITSEVGDQTIKKKKKRKKKGGGGNNNGGGQEGGGGGNNKKKKRKKKKQGQVGETDATSDIPSISPTLPPSPAKKKNKKKKKKKKQNDGGEVENVTDMPSGAPSTAPTTLAPSMRPSIAPSVQASSSPSSSPTTLPTLAPTPDDGITTTEVAMTLSVSYPDTTDTESLLSIVDSSAAFVFQRQIQNTGTYLYQLGTDDALDADTFDVQSRVNATTCGEASVSQGEGEEDIQCGVVSLSVSVDHADSASNGEVRYAVMTLIPDLIERLELQSRDITSASNLGSRAVPYTIVSSLSGVAEARPPPPNAIAAYEGALQRVLSSQPASLGLDILHIEVKSTSVRTVAVADDNIFDKDSELDQKEQLDARRRLQTDGASDRVVAEVTFETLILSEYASEMFPNANVNALLNENLGQVLTLLRIEGGYFQGVGSFALVTRAPTMAPTEPNPSDPSPGAETSGSDSGLSSVVKGAIAASVSIVCIVLLSIGAYLYIRRQKNEKAKKMINDDNFDALQRERRNKLASRMASRNDDFGDSPNTSFATRAQRDVAVNDTTSEASRRRDDEYGWNRVPLDDEFADALEQPAQATRTDLTSRWATFEQDETLEEQKTEANTNAVLMGLRNTIRRAWQGGGTEDDQDQQSADEESALEEGARGRDAENDQDFLGRLQQMYVRGEISRGEFITLKESHLRKVKMQEEEERLAAEAAEDYGYEDHQPTARHDDESFFREKDNDMERLYQDGHITREELEQMKAANERLRKSQVGDGFLEDMSADFDENYDETPLEDENYTEDEDIYTEGDESSSFVSNNDEIDKLYRDGKISAAEWRQMKNTHEALRQEQRRDSLSGDEEFDEYNEYDDGAGGKPPDNEWDDGYPARRSKEEEMDDEAFEEEERRRAQEEEQEAVRRRVAEKFREAEERARADRALMEDYWRRSDDNEDEKDSEYDDEEAYDDFDETQSLGTKETLFTTTNPDNEIQRLYEEGQISATERDQMLQANSQLRHAGEGDDDDSHFTALTTSNEIRNLYNSGKISEQERDQMLQANRALKMHQEAEEEKEEEGKDEESMGTMLTAGDAIDAMFRRGEINEEEYQTMSRQHQALQKEQKRTQKLEEIERMYEEGDVDSTDYRLLVDSYERLQQDPRHRSAGSNIEMTDMSARNLSQPAQNSREVVAPELTPDDTSVTVNPEIEALWREGMLSRQEYEAMKATHQRLREVQSGGKKYQGSRGGPALW